LSQLEGAAHALFFSSGMGAVASLLQLLKTGDRVVLADDTYFAVRALLGHEVQRMGIQLEVVDLTSVEAVRSALSTPAAMVWIETPSNPLLKVTDIALVSKCAREAKALCVVDATFSTPLLSQPLNRGADIVMHSTTKYFAGHSDTMGGALLFHAPALRERLFDIRKLLGTNASPFAAWMTLRGLRTLACRMTWHCQSAERIAAFLQSHPRVARVHYPGLSSHAQHTLARRQMKAFGGVLSFEVNGARADALAVASALRLFTNATSLGSVESLVEHRQSVEGPHSSTPSTLLRLSVGLEHFDDLIDDLRQALDSLPA
jgi:cystathionine gamma-synthase